ncbi:sugar ABC transporter ATP-binding protein [Falsirhodobacter halotolerans]|uniref:sugar ABC transporter ATP-binding protein n=1 Tax=Falsirhodobacter halotolerans TaxID=1146892 RepID=UPI001FD4A25C|nr:sugar ABC transporter ATP-binding protein [Falsirhodobacter halotolerans]MCJ8141288.1 sugar ABC transporter ATP-binding protein [Falsirhodobacter halotolerans]
MTVLSLQDVSRAFGPVTVLHGIDLDLHAGEVHALIGENGAGKSTTMKILSGFLAPTTGEVRLDGAPAPFRTPAEAEAAGIVMIHQEFNLAAHLSVTENVFLGREMRKGPFLDHAGMRAATVALLDRLQCRADPDARIADISVPDRQMVEIAKALSRRARVLIMDEPTAVLTDRETEVLFEQVTRLKAEGVAILYTSHKLGEVRRLADRVTVLRDGRRVQSGPAQGMTEDRMATAMVGRDLEDLFPAKRAAHGEVVLSARDIHVPRFVTGAGFDLHRGEILGLAGLVGAGRTELMEAIAGLRARDGAVTVANRPLPPNDPQAALAAGLVYLTEDRKDRGLLLDKPLRENLTLLALRRFSGLTIRGRAEDEALTRAIADWDIRVPHRAVLAGNLSGGNQQKLLLAKTMLVDPGIVIIDEPTRGIDIGTKQQIYRFIHRIAAEGVSVIVISSELPEVIGLCDRVLVMRQGRIAGQVTGQDVNEKTIVRLAMGLEGEMA